MIDFREVKLKDLEQGSIFLHSMPGRYEDINDFLEEMHNKRIPRIINLAGMEEIKTKSSKYHEYINGDNPEIHISFFPVEDYGVPENFEEYIEFLRETVLLLESGESVLIHCGAGIGRTGMFAICLLIQSGYPGKDAVKLINKAGSNAETDEQRGIIDKVEEYYNSDYQINNIFEDSKISIEDLYHIIRECIPDTPNDLTPDMRISELIREKDPSISEAIYSDILKKMEEKYSVEFSDAGEWTFRSLDEWVEKVNRRLMDNIFIKNGKITWHDIYDLFLKEEDWPIPEDKLTGSVRDFCSYMNGSDKYTKDMSLHNLLSDFIDRYYLTFSRNELNYLNNLDQMYEVYRFFTIKLHKRSPNDCLIIYDKNYSLELRLTTMEILEGSDIYPVGIRMKHITGLFGSIILGGTDLRDEGSYTIGLKNNPSRHFRTIYHLLDAGWAVD